MHKLLRQTSKYVVIGILVLSFVLLVGSIVFTFSSPRTVIMLLERFFPEKEVIIPLKLKGVAVLGDSQADEYRADDSRGLTYASTTLNWVEQLDKFRDVNFGPWGSYGEPRRTGYAYNWARTGATAASMIESGQHIGIASQVKKGEVNLVIIAIGANDYAPYITPDGYDALYAGTIPEARILQKKNRLIADVTTAIDTIRDAGEVRMLLVTIPDWGHHLGVRVAFPLPEQRQAVSTIISETNADLREVASERDIAILDMEDFYTSVFHEGPTEVTVGNETFSAVLPGDDPRSLFLEDGTHAGTVLNGLFANAVITKMNTLLGTTIRPFSQEEILSHAGL